jgi:hypothetical protein
MSAAPEPEPQPYDDYGRVPHWPPLGRLLVDGGLINEAQLEHALAEQRRDGARLGDIVLAKGWVSRLALASVVARQHGLELRAAAEARPEESDTSRPAAWKPLGQLLLEKDLITRIQLQQAIAEQRHSGRRLGEILVSRNWLTGVVLMRLLDEQQGLGLVDQRVDVRVSPPIESSEQYDVERKCAGTWEVVHTSPTYFDATDVAFELLDGDPSEPLRIMRAAGEERERVWFFDPRQSATESTLDVFGYPVTAWGRDLK